MIPVFKRGLNLLGSAPTTGENAAPRVFRAAGCCRGSRSGTLSVAIGNVQRTISQFSAALSFHQTIFVNLARSLTQSAALGTDVPDPNGSLSTAQRDVDTGVLFCPCDIRARGRRGSDRRCESSLYSRPCKETLKGSAAQADL